MTDRILELLYDRREGFFALGELADRVGVDRSRLDEALVELQRAGQRLEISPPNGVRLVRPVRLSGRLIERDLPARRIGRSVICFDEVESTNDVALEAIRQGDTDGLVVLAESQRRGRGRHGRRWVSPPGRNVLFSALLLGRAGAGALNHEAMTIATGLAVAEAVEQTTGLACELKWPNDVLVDGAKLAGVLVEMRSLADVQGVVLGVGINVNAAPDRQTVPQLTTCLADHLGHPVERIETIRALAVCLDAWADDVSAGRLDGLHDRFLSRCRMIHERTTIVCDGQRRTGRVVDIDPLRGMVLVDDDGARSYLPASSSTVIG